MCSIININTKTNHRKESMTKMEEIQEKSELSLRYRYVIQNLTSKFSCAFWIRSWSKMLCFVLNYAMKEKRNLAYNNYSLVPWCSFEIWDASFFHLQKELFSSELMESWAGNGTACTPKGTSRNMTYNSCELPDLNTKHERRIQLTLFFTVKTYW